MREVEYLLDKIYKEDKVSQDSYLDSMSTVRYIDKEYIRKLKAIFIPNQEYLQDIIGLDALDLSYGFYDNLGRCKWVGYLMIPIKDCNDSIVGFTGWSPFYKPLIESQKEGKNLDVMIKSKYIDSSSMIFDKSKYVFIPNGYKHMLENDYVIVVDGVFDSITLGSLGFPVICILGSYLSEQILFILSLVKRRYVAFDNDEAGLSLFKKIKRIDNTTYITQTKFKDIDEYFTKSNKDEFLNQLTEGVSSKILVPIALN